MSSFSVIFTVWWFVVFCSWELISLTNSGYLLREIWKIFTLISLLREGYTFFLFLAPCLGILFIVLDNITFEHHTFYSTHLVVQGQLIFLRCALLGGTWLPVSITLT